MALTKVGKEGITGISNSSDATAITIDSSERVGIGEASPAASLHISTGASTTTEIRLTSNNTGSGSGDRGRIAVHSSRNDGTAYEAGRIDIDRSSGTADEAHILFATNNGSGVAERMRITSAGSLLVGKTDTSTASEGAVFTPGDLMSMTRNGEKVLRIRRNTDDGTLMEFFQDGSQEGKIQVTGSTVQYVGGTLARFSQATDGKRIDGLVKGTVMTNLDQMAVWTKDGVTEENEQLNCMAVSSVEGDANVAGVFVNWDDEDEDYTADMHVAMTGDFVIRIAQDTTVARGDLLMSAGDGTAKPQGDDIVRSKTIAKVTSINKSHTYDDGSYLVPCVLMAC